VLMFLYRNRTSLASHVSQARYGLFYAGYKPTRFFWEAVITMRKVSVVMLAVFGPEIGPEKQAVVAILLLVICIVFEIYGDPYFEKTLKYKILGKLEFCSLFVEFMTMWSGLMIFSLDESNLTSKSVGVALTSLVIVSNIALLIWFIVHFVRATLDERKEAKLEASKHPPQKNKSFLSKRVSSFKAYFRGNSSTNGSDAGTEMVGLGCDYENPMEESSVRKVLKKQKRKIKMQKVRKKLSIGARARRNSIKGGGVKKEGPVENGGNEEKGDTAVTQTETDNACSIYVDAVTGRRYSYDEQIGETKWLAEANEESNGATEEVKPAVLDSAVSEHIDTDTGRRYSYNTQTGETKWLANDG